MLDLAQKHETELQKAFADIALDKRFMYLYGYSWREKYKAVDSTWEKVEFVSLEDDRVIGYLGYCIDRDSYKVSELIVVDFLDEKSIVFARDFKQMLTDIFEKYKFRKIDFSAYIGNPAEKMYDRYVRKYGGRIVGIYKADVRLLDGEYHDRKLYEISRSNYLRAVKP